jgi:hypothetical protein
MIFNLKNVLLLFIILFFIILIYLLIKYSTQPKTKQPFQFIFKPSFSRNTGGGIIDLSDLQTTITFPWFDDLMNQNPGMKQYYSVGDSTLGPGTLSVKLSDGSTQQIGSLTTTINQINVGGVMKSIFDVVTLNGLPKEYTTVWLNVFIETNPGAQKIKDQLIINKDEQKLYIRPKRYFQIKNVQTGRYVHPLGGKDTPDNGTPTVFWDEGNCNRAALKYTMEGAGTIRHSSGLCLGPDYGGTSNGNVFALHDQRCNDTYTFIPDGPIKHNNSGRCIHPDGGVANQGTRMITWSDCTSQPRLKMVQEWCGSQDPDLLIGYTDDNHIGQLRMTDGKWIPIGDAFQLIAGPEYSTEGFSYNVRSNKVRSKEYYYFLNDLDLKWNYMTPLQRKRYYNKNKEYFDFLGIGGAFTNLYNKAKDGVLSAEDWVEARANDVAAFTTAAANSVGTWTKNMANDALNWAKGAGNLIVKNLIDIGNKIGQFARDAANKIAETAINTINTLKNFFTGLYEKARDAFNTAINWIKNAASTVWSSIKEPLVGSMKLILGDIECEYMTSRSSSKLDAIKAIEPALVPPVRDEIIGIIKRETENAIAPSTLGLGSVVIELVFTIVQQFSDFNQKVDSLLEYVFEQRFAVNTITTIADPVIKTIANITCSTIKPPDVSNIKINSSSLNNTSLVSFT